MTAPSPDALAAAERRVLRLRSDLDALTLSLWSAQSHLLDALAAGDGTDAAVCRAYIADDTDRLDALRARYDLADGERAALMFAASPHRLVARALTPDEASVLAARNHVLASARREIDGVVQLLWAAQQLCLTACDGGDFVAAEEWRLYSRDTADGVADLSDYASRALDARAPLLAAQWEAAS